MGACVRIPASSDCQNEIKKGKCKGLPNGQCCGAAGINADFDTAERLILSKKAKGSVSEQENQLCDKAHLMASCTPTPSSRAGFVASPGSI